MKIYKKTVALIMALICVASFSGCKDNITPQNTNANSGYTFNDYKGNEYAEDMYYNYENGGMFGFVNGGSNNNNWQGNNNANNNNNNNSNNGSNSNASGGNSQNGTIVDGGTADLVKWESTALTAPGDVYSNPNISQGGGDSPIIGELSKQVNPGDSITVMGEGFTNAKAYYVANGTAKKAKSLVVNDTQMQVTIDDAEKYGVYGIYIQNSAGTSAIRMVNAPQIWWCGLTDVNAGDEFSVYGENLATNNKSGSNVYLIDGKKHYKMKVTFADPFKVTVQIPKGLENGKTYTIKLHNGHGGEEAWATAPEKITFKSLKVNEWTGNVIDVTKNGVNGADDKDDSAAIQRILNSAEMNDVIYFPEGTYNFKNSVEVNVPVYFKGAGANKTTFAIKGDYSADAMINIKVGPCEFYGIAFEDVRKKAFENAFIDYRGDEYVSGGFNLYIHNCKFLQNCLVKARSQQSPINVRQAGSIIIENNYFETTGFIFTARVQKLFARNNEVCGVCLCGPYYNQNYFLLWSTDRIDASNNKFYGKDLLIDPNGTLETDDYTIGRAFAVQQGSRNVYIAHNDMERVGLPGDNAGEQIMLEDVSNQYEGGVASATANSITSTGVYKTMPTAISKVTIVKGKGVGQYRYVKSVSEKKITLTEPWAIIPDNTSEMMVSSCFDNYAIYKNDIDGFKTHMNAYTATTGVQLYGGCHNIFIVENKFSNMTAGMCITTHFRYNNNFWETNGIYWSQIDRNVITDCSQGIRYKTSHMIAPTQSDIIMYLKFGITIRGNIISNMVDYNFSSRKGLGGVGIEIGTPMNTYVGVKYYETWEGAWQFGTLVENNKLSNCEKANIRLCRHQGSTVLRNNTATGSITDICVLEQPAINPTSYN